MVANWPKSLNMIFRSVDMNLIFFGTNGAGRVRCRSLIFISSVVIVYQWTVDFYFVTLIKYLITFFKYLYCYFYSGETFALLHSKA